MVESEDSDRLARWQAWRDAAMSGERLRRAGCLMLVFVPLIFLLLLLLLRAIDRIGWLSSDNIAFAITTFAGLGMTVAAVIAARLFEPPNAQRALMVRMVVASGIGATIGFNLMVGYWTWAYNHDSAIRDEVNLGLLLVPTFLGLIGALMTARPEA